LADKERELQSGDMGLDVKIGEFDVDDLDDIHQRWALYIDRLARYFKHNGVEGDDMKINDFLLCR
jgi:hypothetical protein